jgi:hypothetical protein
MSIGGLVDTSTGAAVDPDARYLAQTGGIIGTYAETGATLSVVDDGDGTYSVTIPLDGKVYSVGTLTQDIDILTTSAPTPPACGSAVVYIPQAATAKTVSVPTAWYWPDGTAEDFAEDSGLYRLTLYTDPSGNVHADAELRAQAS